MKAFKKSYLIVSFFFLLSLGYTLKNTNLDEFQRYNLESSGYWNIPFNIHIYNNWSETALTYDWCTGSGNWTDPFIIENITIDFPYSGASLSIENTSDYFKIRNCTFSNAGFGILLYNVENGHIVNSTCSNNQESGVFLYNCQNITIDRSCFMDSGVESGSATGDSGIYCFQSSNNYFINNLFCKNNWAGIEMQFASSRNLIFNNTFKNNYKGIYIASSSHSNNITKNIIKFSEEGIYLLHCYNISIHDNTISSNHLGIYSPTRFPLTTQDCSITDNLIYNNTSSQIHLFASINALISGNEISTSRTHIGVHFFKTNHSLVKNNVIINNHETGIMIIEGEQNIILSNKISKSQTGIYIERSSYNNITSNRISDCEQCIFQDATSKDNIIEANVCIEPSVGGFDTHTIISLIFFISIISIFIVKKRQRHNND